MKADCRKVVEDICATEHVSLTGSGQPHPDEYWIKVDGRDFNRLCSLLHKRLRSPVKMFFAEDARASGGSFVLRCVFLCEQARCWVGIERDLDRNSPVFESLSRDIYSASLFEREMLEMFGLQPQGNPDLRRLRLHDEVWPQGWYPLRKDFPADSALPAPAADAAYRFNRVEGEGVFEVPVGPVHAGIIGPGHFRFSAAGEPIINLELRLGWTHRGVEKLLEGRPPAEAVKLIECVSGDSAFGYSLAFCQGIEKICGVCVPEQAQFLRAALLELERIYNHANDIGGMALDVGFSFPAQFASVIKETVLEINKEVSGSRYLKGLNLPGGFRRDVVVQGLERIVSALPSILRDFSSLEEMLLSSGSFMDRLETTGILRFKTAFDLGIVGLVGRASGIAVDMRKVMHGVYDNLNFAVARESSGDVADRLNLRFREVRESVAIIRQCLGRLSKDPVDICTVPAQRPGCALGCVEAWRGPVCIWTRVGESGLIERCKIVDPSFHNWEGLSFAVLGNIIPDFPLCNKSFDLSYSGNDL